MSIERTKGVTPLGVEGERTVEWQVKLSHEPPKSWRDAFKNSDVRAEFADPHDVVFRRNALLFKCREDQLGVWIECIDGWITHANRAEVEAKEASLRKAAAQEAETQNRAQHLTELRDKYKDL
jgi:hypothetical protein